MNATAAARRYGIAPLGQWGMAALDAAGDLWDRWCGSESARGDVGFTSLTDARRYVATMYRAWLWSADLDPMTAAEREAIARTLLEYSVASALADRT